MAPSLSASLVVPSLMTLKSSLVFSFLYFSDQSVKCWTNFWFVTMKISPRSGIGREMIDDVFEHRLARDGQQRLGLVEREGIEAGGVPGGEDEHLHTRWRLTRSR